VCFAPEADAVVGGIIVIIGIDALRHVEEPKQLALASVPMLLGVHQLTEAFVWWGVQDHVAHPIERVAVWTYLLIAFAALPIVVPVAVGLVERSAMRRRIIVAFGALGVAVAVALTISLFRGPINAVIGGRYIAYHVDELRLGGPWTGLYVVATCGALLASSYRDLEVFGALNLVAIPVLMWLTVGGFVSLWCFWAAIASIIIALHLRRARRSRRAIDLAAEIGLHQGLDVRR